MKVPSMQQGVLLILAAAVVAGLLSLGFWQLDRARYKDNLLDALAQGQSSEPGWLENLSEVAELPRFSPIKLRGRYDPRTLLLDNRTRNGRAGIEVVSPFQLTDAGGWILVNRGWLPLPPDRTLPSIETPSDTLELEGLVDRWPQVGVQMGSYPELGQLQPVLVPWLDPVRVDAMLGNTSANRVLLLGADQAFGFERDWQPQFLPPERHRGYALQWFGLAATLVILVLVLTVRHSRKQ